MVLFNKKMDQSRINLDFCWISFFLCLSCVLLLVLALIGAKIIWPWQEKPLLLAPMIGAVDICLISGPDQVAACAESPDSATRVINATLDGLGPRLSADGKYELGYTLNVPLLRMFRPTEGGWQVDVDAAKRIARTISDVSRPMVLYLFSTHFSVGGALETQLLEDPSNLAQTTMGPLAKDSYFGLDIMPWSVARTDNQITERRKQAMAAVLNEICQLPPSARRNITGVTVLGEVHQLFPDFEGGMGFGSDYIITDYSATSIQAFRGYLNNQFGNVDALNRALGANYASFDDVLPPFRDIRKTKLDRFQEHIDAYAGGVLPITGWMSASSKQSNGINWVHIYLNGERVARVPATLGRQDVLKAKPELGTADVGWRHDIDFAGLPPALYRIDVALEAGTNPLMHVGTRTVSIVDRTQATPLPLPQKKLPTMVSPGPGVQYSIDSPKEALSVFYNSLVPLWHAFRSRQVIQYLQYHKENVRQSCLGNTPIYTHQIVPFTNPSWDASKFAIDHSVEGGGGMALGISLYGESVYGGSIAKWMQSRRFGLQADYGITEFHPLREMTPKELENTFQKHRTRGAKFVSFFLEGRWSGRRMRSEMNTFSMDPENPLYGSDVLYESMSTLLGAKLARQ